MQIESIISSSNALIKKVAALHKRAFREKYSLFLIEGEKLVEEALLKDVEIEQVIVSEAFFKEGLGRLSDSDLKKVITVPDKLFAELSTTSTPTGVLAVAKQPTTNADAIFSKQSLVLIAESIQDPGNLGTMIRTALAASASGLIATKGSVDAFNPKVVRAAMGASFSLPQLWDVEGLEAMSLCRKNNLQILALDANAEKAVWQVDLTKPTAVIVGSEGHGINKDLIDEADARVSIPMNPLCESLNAAQAVSIVLFEAVRQRL